MAPPSTASAFHAVISGAGSGTGRALALRFARSYSVVLMARRAETVGPIVDEIRAAGGSALGIAADASDPAAVDDAFARIRRDLPGSRLAAAVYNANAGFAMKPFLDLELADMQAGLSTSTNGFFLFAKKTVPQLLDAVSSAPHPPTLLVTGATASLRGGNRFATFAAGKFAQRALAQSLAREFGPKGVHVALAIIDGGIDVPWAPPPKQDDGVEDKKLKPEAIADSYWHLHEQHRSAWTHELDLRPYVEKF